LMATLTGSYAAGYGMMGLASLACGASLLRRRP
jgi:hypothetical protein